MLRCWPANKSIAHIEDEDGILETIKICVFLLIKLEKNYISNLKLAKKRYFLFGKLDLKEYF